MSYEAAKALINKGYSRPSLYALQLNNNKASRYEQDYMSMFCRSISIPGASHEVVTALGQVALGVQEDIPTAIKFGDRPIVAEIIDNRDLDMYKLFRGLFDDTALSGANPTGRGNDVRTQRMKYYDRTSDNTGKDNYTFDFDIKKLEYPTPGERVVESINDPIEYYHTSMTYKFIKGYVTSISEIQLGSNMFDTFMTFRVGLNYETYYYDKERDHDGETYRDLLNKNAKENKVRRKLYKGKYD